MRSLPLLRVQGVLRRRGALRWVRATASDCSFWLCTLIMASGHRLRPWLPHIAFGHFLWTWPLIMASSLSFLLRVLAMAYGLGLWPDLLAMALSVFTTPDAGCWRRDPQWNMVALLRCRHSGGTCPCALAPHDGDCPCPPFPGAKVRLRNTHTKINLHRGSNANTNCVTMSNRWRPLTKFANFGTKRRWVWAIPVESGQDVKVGRPQM